MVALSLHGQPLSTFVIAPGKAAPVVVNALPRAACTLRAQGDSGVPHSMTLYSDDQGHVRFHVQAKAESISPPQLDLECQSGNQTANYSIEVTANTALAAIAPAAAAPSQTGTVRPPLTGDPMAPSQSELISRGYPPRPDPVQLPEAYATWLRIVTTPMTMVEPKLIQQPNRFHVAANPNPSPVPSPFLPSTGTSSNWSGLVLYQDARLFDPVPLQPYDIVSAEWIVPAVTGEPNIQDDSAFWTGMDGWGSNNVLQDGTEQQAFTFAHFGIQFTIANYYAWTEFFPFPEQLISNFNVSPGDHIGAVVSGKIGTGSGLCFLVDLTTGIQAFVSVSAPPGITFTGNSAEWIMERPTVNGSLPDLSNYSAATMFNAFASRFTALPTEVNSSGNINSLNVTMVNANNQILSEVVPTSDTSMTFQWKGFK